MALYIPEKDMLTADLLQKSTKGPLREYLQKHKMDTILNGNPYQILRTDDWLTLTNAAQFSIKEKKVKVLKKRSDYNENDRFYQATSVFCKIVPYVLSGIGSEFTDGVQ